MKPGTRIAAIVGATCVGTLAIAQLASANTYRPNKVGDHAPGACTTGDCTLREAVIAANAHGGSDRILLGRGKTYGLSRTGTGEDAAATGDLDITDSLTIKRAAAKTRRQRRLRAVVDANGIDRVFESAGTLTLVFNGLVVRGGNSIGDSGDGGIDIDEGTAAIVNSVVRNNRGADDGGIGSDEAALTLRRTRVAANRGDGDVGGIDGNGSSLTLIRSVVSHNTGSSNGGGLYVGDRARIVRSTIDHNHASPIDDGGGIFLSSATTTIVASTIFENTAELGGGIALTGNVPVIVRNSTIANNAATGDGGGMHLASSANLTLNSVTLVRNLGDSDATGGAEGGGIYRGGGTTATIGNTIIELNELGISPSVQQNCSGIFVTAGHNLLGDDSCNGLTGPGDQIKRAPKLGGLARNGGPTPTVALLRGSPAINKGGADAEKRDQRGRKRVGNPDVGAFEFSPKR